eukprot:TRINITY_DN9745_c0_g1_i1.p1 TRINITY_DN9745_c0_g1~~TRINITY_DN9745_c0_g1_i1.p1  ORF type:complete len:294 (-),score=44.60 TRINITY_DN9745_c0_g1_i1:33-914(-)
MENKAHRIRWAVNFEEWCPTQEEWQHALTFLQPEEVSRIGRFKRPIAAGVYLTGHENPDAKSSLIGRLLMRKVVHTICGLPYENIKMARTSKGKPYLVNKISGFTNFNFNVSHAGDYVVCGAEYSHLVGVDVMKVEVRGRSKLHTESERIEEFFSDMQSCFTDKEWRKIRQPVTPHDRLTQFYLHWTLKEGYIKAVGIGLGFELLRAEFTLENDDTTAKIAIDGKEKSDWHFEIHRLSHQHVASVAYGPPKDVDESCEYINSKVDVASSRELPRVDFSVLLFSEITKGMKPLK